MLVFYPFALLLSECAPFRISCVHSCTTAANTSETTILLPTMSGKYFNRIHIGFTAAFSLG